jgi:hypothetical protein
VSEADYWVSLEFRLCREFAGMRDGRLRFLWCDGLIPGRWFLDDASPRITGHTWICSGRWQEEWKFTLFLNAGYASGQELEWQRLLPPDNVTGWLAIDLRTKCIEIEPAAAMPDEEWNALRPPSPSAR